MATLDPTRPFTTAMARAAGISPGRLRGPAFRTLLRGVHLCSEAPVTLALRAEAAVLVHRAAAVVTHHSAAALQLLPVPPCEVVHVSVTRAGDRRPRPGLRVHVGVPTQVSVVAGIQVSTGVSLFLEMAGELGLVDLVVLGDALVRRGLTTPAVLREAAPRGTHAHRAAAYVRERVDSPMETRVRLLLVLAGFPEPVVNPTVDPDGAAYRPDLCWPTLRLVVEYDGRHHRADLDQWDHDIDRREWFDRRGWTTVTVVARDVFQRPDQLLARVREHWVRCGGERLVLRDEWRAHFPSPAAPRG